MNNRIFKPTRELAPFICEMIKNGKCVQLTVTGNSMFPLFAHLRDSVVVKRVGKYQKYDIVLYLRTNGDLILHRVVDVKDDILYICGDNQTLIEYPIFEEQVIGKVVTFTRKNKKYSVNNIFYRVYSKIWCFDMDFRQRMLRFALKVWRFIKR